MSPPAFSQLESLAGLAQRGVDVKPTLLRVLTDLYIQSAAHTPEEERQYVELALRLIDAVDPATRKAVALKLANYPAAPRAIMQRLLAHHARPKNSSALQERTASSSATSVTLTPRVARSQARDAADLTEAFFRANPETRKTILENLHATLQAAVSEPAVSVNCSRETIQRLESAVLSGRPGDFIRELERTLDLSRALAERIVNDVSGEPLVVAAKALAMPIDVLQRILLFVNPAIGHSVKRVYGLSALYGEVSAATAVHLISLWRAAQPHQASRGQSSHAAARALRDRANVLRPSGAPQAKPSEPQRQRTT